MPSSALLPVVFSRYSRAALFALMLVFLLPLIAFSGTTTADYEEADRHALSAPASAERDMRRLSAYLTEPFEGNEALQARALFRWITDRIRYDTSAYFGGAQSVSEAGPEQVLETRQALCGGYAALFTFMATEAGLEAVTINGHSKGYGFSPEQARRQGLESNHAWNAVRIDGDWKLLDATWGAGFIDEESLSFAKSFEEHYFFTAAESFIYDHFPEDERWQLLDTPLNEDQYLDMAWVRPAFFQHGLRLDSHRQQRIETAGPVVVELGVPEESILNARLSKNGTEPTHEPLLVHHRGNRGFVELTPPERGTYELELFVRKAANTGQEYTWAMSYTIESRRETSHAGYPETFAQFLERRSYLEQPRSYLLERGNTQRFSLHVPGAQEISVINDGQWTPLSRDGHHFSGDVPLKQGDVQVVGRFSPSQSGSYEVMLQYMAR
ncbi:MAG: transglutaminase domain-containing protein [Cyclonatronaceae bacterium]